MHPRTSHATLPPFGITLPLAELPVISLDHLLAGKANTQRDLYEACRSLGFFYLDLRGSDSGDALIDASEQLLRLAQKFMSLPREEKEAYGGDKIPKDVGYRYIEDEDALNEQGSKVRKYEGYATRKDDLLGISSNPAPLHPLISRAIALLQSFTRQCRSIVDLVLGILETHLQLDQGVLADLHRCAYPSGDLVRFNHAPPALFSETKAQSTEHTDFGSLTILFNWLGGLQVRCQPVQDGGPGEWRYVEPKAGHCVINIGDALVKFTGGLLKSNVHRIVPANGAQYGLERDSIVYLCRPENGVALRSLKGGLIDLYGTLEEGEAMSSEEWMRRRTAGDLTGVYTKDGGHQKRSFVIK